MSDAPGTHDDVPVPRGAGPEQPLAAFLATDRVVDLLAARQPLPPAATEDPLLGMLGSWAAAIDTEVAAATTPPRVPAQQPLGPAVPAGGGPAAPTAARRRRFPWWALSASAAAVLTVLAVGAALQDVTDPAPGTTVAESVTSVESTLLAARAAAEAGDHAAARVLLERARDLVERLAVEDREGFVAVLDDTEEQLRTAERAAEQGDEPADPWDGGGGAGQGGAGQGGAGQGGALVPDPPGVGTPHGPATPSTPSDLAPPDARPTVGPTPGAPTAGRPTAAPTSGTLTPGAGPTTPAESPSTPPASPSTPTAPDARPVGPDARPAGPGRGPSPGAPSTSPETAASTARQPAPPAARPTAPGDARPADPGGP